MRLTTKIMNSANEPVNVTITSNHGETLLGPRTEVRIQFKDKVIGFLKYSIQENCLYIHRMDNYSINSPSPFKYVGSLLFEYAFNKSVKSGKGGRIALDAIEESPPAYFKMGLRKKSDAGVWLDSLITKYKATLSPDIKVQILKHGFYDSLKSTAATNLNKNAKEITFEQAINNGIYSAYNNIFAEEMKNKRISIADCLRLYMHGIMYVPPEIIQQKKVEFSQFKPIGSNVFFSKENALSKLKNDALKSLVEKGILDASNAIEIEAKISRDDPRLACLLSPIGLKMLKRNYISGWYIGVYVHHLEDVKAITSANGLKAFEDGLIENMTQLTNQSTGTIAKLLTNAGLELLQQKELCISKYGSLKDKNDNYVSSEELDSMLLNKNIKHMRLG